MKKCKQGYYYCNTSKKCKKIPKGHHVMPSGYLMRDSEHEEEGKRKTVMVMVMEITRMAMATGMAGLMGDLVMAAEEVSLKRGVQGTRGQLTVITQKDSLKKHTVGVARR